MVSDSAAPQSCAQPGTGSDAGSNEDSPFTALFRSRAAAPYADKPFLIDDRTLTYADVTDCARRLGAFFDARGVAVGDRGVIISEDGLAVALLFLSFLANGVTAVVLDPNATAEELKNLLAASDASIAFLDEAVIARLAMPRTAPLARIAVTVEVVANDFLESRAPSPNGRTGHTELSFPGLLRAAPTQSSRPRVVPSNTAAYILFTSGSTSTPKGVEFEHGALFECLGIMCRQLQYEPDCKVLNVLPLHHADGLSEGVAMTFFAGGTLHRPAKFTPKSIPTLLTAVAKHSITHFHAVPAMLAMIERGCPPDWKPFRTPSFRFVISSGGPLTADTWRAFEDRFAVRVTNVYGMTEAGRELLFCGPDDATRRLGTNGKPVGCEMSVIDDAGLPVATGQVGELVFRAKSFMRGYFRRPDDTAEVLRDGSLRTGDLALQDADGFVTVVGRKKNIIVSGGINIHPEEVSEIVARLPGVVDVVTFGMADDVFGERVVACVVAAPASELTTNGVFEHCRKHLATEKMPHDVFFLPVLPHGPGGKVMLPQVKAMIASLLEQAESQRASQPPLDVHDRVLALAARCFKIPAQSLSRESEPDSTVGWNSLAHMDFIVALEAEFGVTIDPAATLDLVTLGDAIDLVQRLQSIAATTSRPTEREE